ncbi:hypothetical protein [Mycobacterium sp. 852002-51057_SCH5723018]|uniref:hypothetical protein n=1 Tax=Mycobacterium sp. 852002-51057_SCH5723018 TaxID=1834094 RepID=UPI000AA0B79C|nr:hypothetical protein [Mycobacterium sp. 852002-51057_SCH5723018]
MKTSIGEIPSREIVDELIRRVSAPETCRLIGVPESTDLHQLADDMDRWVPRSESE